MANENADKKVDGRKLSIYMDLETADELRAVAAKLDRSVSWVLAKAFQIAKNDIK